MDGIFCSYKFCPRVKTVLPEDRHYVTFLQQITDEEHRVKETHEAEIKSTAENPRVRQQTDFNDISQELGHYRHEQDVEAKERQRLRESCLELRRLQVQLQTAYAAKQLSEQRELQERRRLDERRSIYDERDRFAEELRQMQEQKREQNINESRKKELYRKGLQEQMLEKQKIQQQQCEEVLREREQRLKAEKEYKEYCETQEKEALQRKLQRKKEVADYLHIHAIAKEKLREAEKRIVEIDWEYLRQRDEQQEANARAARERRARQEALSERIGQQVFDMETEKRSSENMLLDLLVEERRNKEEMRSRETLEKLTRDRENSRIEGQNYRKDLLRYKQMIEKREDDIYLTEAERRNAEIAEKEALEREKRRQTKLKYGNDMRFLIDYKRRQVAARVAESLKQDEDIANMNRKKQEIIEDERLRMLRRQPPEIIAFIRPGTLRDNERKFLGVPWAMPCRSRK